ncbi:MAG TPA: hypothetical protein VEC18_01605 [Myxococcota bacterium]|nr:hypothetical protein [Myxococcota bacterium]
MANGRARSGAASARRLAASSIAFSLLLAAAPALADGAFWSRGRFDPPDARLLTPERDFSLELLQPSRSLSRPALRRANSSAASLVPRETPIELRVTGPLTEESAAGLALEIRF